MRRSRTIACFVVLLVGLSAAARAAEEIGEVARVQNEAYALAEGGERRLAAGDAIHDGERVVTGPDARIEVIFVDGTSLTLGSNAVMRMDELVFDGTGGSMALDMLSGAFAFTTGLIGQNDHESVRVTTPVA
ncbi:MAG: FecR domain-containing protein, partial [Phycisphaeraceae bacterium]|nr:FecR domain-containing protein [Phycisphaeraceae bacterium]